MKSFYRLFALIAGVCTAMTGYTIHHGWFWTTCDFFFWPLAIIKWLVFHEVNFTILKQTFGFLGN